MARLSAAGGKVPIIITVALEGNNGGKGMLSTTGVALVSAIVLAVFLSMF